MGVSGILYRTVCEAEDGLKASLAEIGGTPSEPSQCASEWCCRRSQKRCRSGTALRRKLIKVLFASLSVAGNDGYTADIRPVESSDTTPHTNWSGMQMPRRDWAKTETRFPHFLWSNKYQQTDQRRGRVRGKNTARVNQLAGRIR
jgi:hypothetical protein